MKLFHVSTVQVSEPMILQSNRNLDFGTGFYTTTNKNQAEEFAVRVFKNRKSGKPTLNIYLLDFSEVKKNCKIRAFKKPNGDWLDFVSEHRNGTYSGKNYDLIIGPVANDDVFRTITLYLSGAISRSTALESLKVKELFNQYVFCSEIALQFLKFESSFIVEGA